MEPFSGKIREVGSIIDSGVSVLHPPSTMILILQRPVRELSPSERIPVHADKLPSSAAGRLFVISFHRFPAQIAVYALVRPVKVKYRSILRAFKRHCEGLRRFKTASPDFSKIQPISQKWNPLHLLRHFRYQIDLAVSYFNFILTAVHTDISQKFFQYSPFCAGRRFPYRRSSQIFVPCCNSFT